MIPFRKLHKEVVSSGLCTHCGTCIALSKGVLQPKKISEGIIPDALPDVLIPDIAYESCPGKGLNYPELYQSLYGYLPKNWLIGGLQKAFIGYSNDDKIRRGGASAGILTHVFIYLLKTGEIDGVILSRLKKDIPYEPESFIATTEEEILQSAQSIYQPVPVNLILEESSKFKGKLAYCGLPDQISAIRILQNKNHEIVSNIHFCAGPYVGINMYQASLKSFLQSNGINNLGQIKDLDYRAGEWPGYLKIETKTGKIVKAEKFYYNYLLPFFVTNHSLYSVDFSNELADISIGDAWHPKYEKERKGFSVVLSRSAMGSRILNEMHEQSLISLDEITVDDALNMHGHMFDFKKRGSFIRMRWRKRLGKKVPDYGYYPKEIPFSRYIVEVFISSVFLVCRTKISRYLIRFVPISILGRVFNSTRKGWKEISKPTKRKGLSDVEFEIK